MGSIRNDTVLTNRKLMRYFENILVMIQLEWNAFYSYDLMPICCRTTFGILCVRFYAETLPFTVSRKGGGTPKQKVAYIC